MPLTAQHPDSAATPGTSRHGLTDADLDCSGPLATSSTPETPAAAGSPADLIAQECDALKALLLEKNRAYGNSALEPVRIFSRASPEEQILVRIDDKITRLARGDASRGMDTEDVVKDLLGYLILLRVARKTARMESESLEGRLEKNESTHATCTRCGCKRLDVPSMPRCTDGKDHSFWTSEQRNG